MNELKNRDPEPEYPLPGWRGLGVFWAIVLGTIAAGGVLLQTLGPPREGHAGLPHDQRPVAQSAGPSSTAGAANVQASANPHSEAAKALSSDAIGALLVKVQAQIAENPDGVPPGSSTADMLKRVSAALPSTSPQDRERVKDMAADLYDRAKTAMEAGKVDEEQRWLALGSILAPPPDLTPSGPGNTIRTAQEHSSPSAAQPRQDITPNESEGEQPAQERARSIAAGPRQDDASAQVGTERAAPQPGDTSAPAPATAEGKPADPAAQAGTAEAATSSDTSSTAGGTEQASGTSLSIHVLASAAPTQEQKLKELTARLRSNFGQTETHAEPDVPSTAVVVYSPADHSTAKDVGRVLGAMGYPWHLERVTDERAEAAPRTVDVWLPSGEPAAQEFRSTRRIHVRSRGWLPRWLPFWF